MRRIILLTVMALGLLAQTAAARGPAQIVNGTPASSGEYPSQGFLLFQVGEDQFSCGGTLVAPTKFLTAAHCSVDDDNKPLPSGNFDVFLGKTNLNDYFPNPGTDERFFVDTVDVHPRYADDIPGRHSNDVAMLTLETAAPFSTTRVIKPSETALWTPGTDSATIIGWGAKFEGDEEGSDALLEATVPIRTDNVCASSYGDLFVATTMVCAGNGSSDTCQGDSGGPLLVGPSAPLVLAGVVSWGIGCNRPTRPGIYTRVGAPGLNAWVRGRLYDVDFTVSATPRAGAPTNFAAIAPGSTGLQWDFDADGVFDATGASASHTYPAQGTYEAVLRVADPEGQPAEQRRTVVVGTPTVTDTTPPPPVPTGTGPLPQPDLSVQPPLATILALSKPKVRRGRFGIRLNFAENAPRGVAVVEVFRGKKKIGGGRTRVRRGDSRRVTVKLTKAGKRLLRRSSTKRLKVRVQVRVKRQVLRSKTVTLRR